MVDRTRRGITDTVLRGSYREGMEDCGTSGITVQRNRRERDGVRTWGRVLDDGPRREDYEVCERF